MSVVDCLGRVFPLGAPPSRVVSLVPSLTETLFALGAGDSLVGVTDFCIFPQELRSMRLARVGGTKNPSIEQIRSLEPDLVHMNLEENLERHADSIAGFAPVFVSAPRTVDDVSKLIVDLGRIHGREAAAAEWCSVLGEEQRAAGSTVREFSFACPIWKNPWMWCGADTYVSALVTEVGGLNVLEGISRYPALALDDVMALQPDVIFLPDEPYIFTAADREAIVKSRPQQRIVGPFPGHLFTWHGTRTVEGLRFLRETLAR